MNLVDQLLELTALHRSGELDDDEYRDAKAAVIASCRLAAGAPPSAGMRQESAANRSAAATAAFPEDPDATLAFPDMNSTHAFSRLGDMSALDSDATQPFDSSATQHFLAVTERSIDLSSDTLPFPSPDSSHTADSVSDDEGESLSSASREVKSELPADALAEMNAAGSAPSRQQSISDPPVATVEVGDPIIKLVRRENLQLFRDHASGTGMVH